MKSGLVESHRERIARIERGELKVVGQNCFAETEDSPLTRRGRGILHADPQVERERIEALEQWRAQRDQAGVDAALAELADAARDEGTNIMPATIAAAKAGATTGEWAGPCARCSGPTAAPPGSRRLGGAGGHRDARRGSAKGRGVTEGLGRPIRILVGKPGLDGHPTAPSRSPFGPASRHGGHLPGNPADPEQIVNSAVQEDVDVVGLSILSGSHRELVPRVISCWARTAPRFR